MRKKWMMNLGTIALVSALVAGPVLGMTGCTGSGTDTSSSQDASTSDGTSDGAPDGAPPDGGNGTPPDKPDGEGGGPGGDSSESVTLTGANTADGKKVTYDGKGSDDLTSENSDENTVLATNGGSYTLTNAALTKSGDTSSADNSNFYALNAILAATENSTVTISDSKLSSTSEGSNAIFATGSDAKIYAKNVTVNTTGNSSRGLDATYEGTVIASDVDITTSGEHCAATATDRGGGYISVDGGTLNTSGQGSPLIYSTGVIEVNDVTGEATGAQIVGMEGLNTVRIKNSNLTGSANKASESVANGVIIYQSTSGDSSTGTATFEASDSTLVSKVSGGAMFYVTNTDADIVLSNVNLDFDADKNTLLTAAGNDASNGWGTAGSNGGNVTLTADAQTLEGDISCDGISTVTCYLTNGSKYTGSIINDTTYTGDGGVSMNLSSDSTWIVEKDSSLLSLTMAKGAKLVDSKGKTVTVKTSDGKTVVKGTSSITVTADSYSAKDNTSSAGTISDFTIDRS